VGAGAGLFGSAVEESDQYLTYEYCVFSDCGALAGLSQPLGGSGFGLGVSFDVSLEIDIPFI
jgi:hypothetical protein